MRKQKNWKRRIYNPRCHKMGYGSKKEAHRIASIVLKNPKQKLVTMLGAYKCPDCGDWHLTSKQQKKQEKMIYV